MNNGSAFAWEGADVVAHSPINDAIAQIIEARSFSTVFQPIVNLRTGMVLGYEALTRLQQPSGFQDTGELFDVAGQLGWLSRLESACRCSIFQAAADWPRQARLFINHSPMVMMEPDFTARLQGELAGAGLNPEQIVLEITERTDFTQLLELSNRLTELRGLGVDIALDDVGAGLSGLNRIMALRPTWVKLDRQLTTGIDHHPLKQNLVRSLLRFTSLSNMHLLAEGIERPQELAVLIGIGVGFGQGYHLARPKPIPTEVPGPVRQSITDLHKATAGRRHDDPSTVRLSRLVERAPVVDAATTVGSVLELLENADGAVLLDGRRYGGVVHRDQLEAFCHEHGAGAPVGEMTRHPYTVIGVDFTLAEALEIAASRPTGKLEQPLVLQRAGEIQGLISLRALLAVAAESHRRMPSRVAALTAVPSRAETDQWLSQRMAAGDPQNICFIDIRDFDAYNAAYGFEMGDAMLLRMVGLINTLIQDEHLEDYFFGHVSEDRFLLASRRSLDGLAERLIARFNIARNDLFTAIDGQAGFFRCPSDGGRPLSFPLNTLRVISLHEPLRQVRELTELYDIAHDLRLTSSSDRDAGTAIIHDRRRAAQRAAG